MRTPDFFDVTGYSEELSHTTEGDAIDDFLGNHIGEWPETVTLTAYGRQIVSELFREHLSQTIMENIGQALDDNNYGDPNQATVLGPEEWKTAQAKVREAVDAFIAGYHIWACDILWEREVNLFEWIEENEYMTDDPDVIAWKAKHGGQRCTDLDSSLDSSLDTQSVGSVVTPPAETPSDGPSNSETA